MGAGNPRPAGRALNPWRRAAPSPAAGARDAAAGARLGRDTTLSLAAIGLVGGSAALYHVLVGRALGPGPLGAAGVALAVGLGGAQLATAGLAPAITRFAAAARAAGDGAAARRVLARGVAAAAVAGVGIGLAIERTAGLWSERIGLPAALAGPAAALFALQCGYIGFKAALYGAGRVRAYAAAELAAGTAFAVGLGAVLAGAPVGLLAPFAWANAAFIAAAGLGLLAAADPSKMAGRRDGGAWPSVRAGLRPAPTPIRYTVVATLGSAAALARLQLPVVLTAAWWPAAEVGRLGAALAFLPPVMLVPRALELALLPVLAAAWERGDAAGLAGALRRSTAAIAVIAGGLASALVVLAPAVLGALFGPAFEPAAPALRLVVAAAALQGLAVPAVAALSASDGVAVPNAAGVAGLVAAAAGWWLWVAPHGATGAAAGLAAGAAVNAGIPLAVAWRRFGRAGHPS